MPVSVFFINENSIPRRVLSKEEEDKLFYLQSLKFPRDRHTIENLEEDDFKRWIYSMPPLVALQLASTRKFAWMRQRINGKESFEERIRLLNWQIDKLKETRKWWRIF